MKYRITQKETRQNFVKVFQVGHCEIQNIDYFLSPQAYNSGVNGWNYDLYVFGKYAISMGYRPIGIDVNESFINTINEIVRKYYKLEHENKKEFKECQLNCELEIYNFISSYGVMKK